jgi:hypothetical protein
MAKTVNRRPLSVTTDSDDLPQETYFNFAEFKGLNTNRNYVTIDQNSFSEVNNMYVNQNGELSTRPPLKKYNIATLGIDADEVILHIYKVNSLLIYHTRKPVESYYEWYVKFVYNGQQYSKRVQADINVMWYDDKYVIYNIFSIEAFAWDYDKNELVWYNADDVVYVPVTNVVYGGNPNDAQEAESKNIFTDKEITRYLFDRSVDTDQRGLIGKDVEFELPDVVDSDGNPTKFEITWVVNNDKVFVSKLSTIDANYIQASDHGTLLATLSTDITKCWYSLDGNVFLQINGPSNKFARHAAIRFMSNDSLTLWWYFTDGSAQAESAIYYASLPYENDVSAIVWNSISLDETQEFGVNSYSQSSSTGYSTIFTATNIPRHGVGVSTEGADCVIYFPNAPCNYKNYSNSSKSYSETGTESTGTMTGTLIISINKFSAGLFIGEGISDVVNVVTNLCKAAFVKRTYNVFYLYQVRNNSSNKSIIPKIITFSTDMMPYAKIELPSSLGRTKVDFYQDIITPVDDYEELDSFVGTTLYSYDAKFDLDFEAEEAKCNICAACTEGDVYYTINYPKFAISTSFIPSKHNFKYTYKGSSSDNDRNNDVLDLGSSNGALPNTTLQIISTSRSSSIKMSRTENIVTNKYFRYNGYNIAMLDMGILRAIYLNDEGDTFIVQDRNDTLWTNNYDGQIAVDYTTGSMYNYLIPTLVDNFVTGVISIANKVYWSSKREGKIYFPEDDVVEFADEPTALVVFSQTVLGIFLENNVYELQYDSDNDLYQLLPTKLQLGNRRNSDVLLNYDGQTIFVTTIKGLSSLNYQDFVQSTEQVYTYLTENIMDDYDKYRVGPIKLYQYKDWLFMYRQDTTILYVLDLRNASWWKWTNFGNVQQIVFDGEEIEAVVDGYLYYYDFKTDDFRDNIDARIDWKFVSQKMHFTYPNNYKHIRSLTVFNSQEVNSLRYKMSFRNYRSLFNSEANDTVEYQVNREAEYNVLYGIKTEPEQHEGLMLNVKGTKSKYTAKLSYESKNLIVYPYADEPTTAHGVTIVTDGEGVFVGGEMTEAGFTWYFALNRNNTLKAGTYNLTGCPVTNPNRVFKLKVETTEGVTLADDYGTGAVFTLDKDTAVNIYLVLYEGFKETLILFRPMLERGSKYTGYIGYITPETDIFITEHGTQWFNYSDIKSPTSISTSNRLADDIIVKGGYELACILPYVSDSAFINVPIHIVPGQYSLSCDVYLQPEWDNRTVYLGIWNWSAQTYSRQQFYNVPKGRWTHLEYLFTAGKEDKVYIECQWMGDSSENREELGIRNVLFKLYSDKSEKIDYVGFTFKTHINRINEIQQLNGTTNVVGDYGVRVIGTFTKEVANISTTSEDKPCLSAFLKRVNFIKTNAFQFAIENDKTDDNAEQFVTPNIAIKYRITERLR